MFTQITQISLTLSHSEGQTVTNKKRCANTGSKQTAMDKIMVSQWYGCRRAFGATPGNEKEQKLIYDKAT